MLAVELERRQKWADRRLAVRAVPGLVLVVVTLCVGATRVPGAAGLGSGDRPGNFLSWLALAGVVAALATSRRADHPVSTEAAVGAIVGALVIALTLWSAVVADGATPWPLVGVLGCCWIAGVAIAELVRRVDDKRVHGRQPFEQRLAELRQRARQAANEDGSADG
ncbi:MAG: hypothetical protein H0U29_06805 [Acidimicrobiia bacterium]|nr:hypothetical protein [Acidimicrobiia bacterium]